MSQINDWIQVPTKVWDSLENDKLVIDICSFCKADQDEWGGEYLTVVTKKRIRSM